MLCMSIIKLLNLHCLHSRFLSEYPLPEVSCLEQCISNRADSCHLIVSLSRSLDPMRVGPEASARSHEEIISAGTGVAPASPDPTGLRRASQNSTPGVDAPLEIQASYEDDSAGHRADAGITRVDSRGRLLLPPLSVTSPHGRRLSTTGSEKKEMGTYSPQNSSNGRQVDASIVQLLPILIFDL